MTTLIAAMMSRKAADTEVPIMPPIGVEVLELVLEGAAAASATPIVASTTTVEWPSEKNRPSADRPLALLHQLARDVVDGGDVVGIDRVAQPEAVGEEAGAEQHRMVVERDQRPGPGGDVGGDQQRVERDDPGRADWRHRR